MSVLSTLLAKRQSVREGVDYLEQEILGAILALVERIQAAEEIQRAHIGVEVIIKVIRGACSPMIRLPVLMLTAYSFDKPSNVPARPPRSIRIGATHPGRRATQHHADFHFHERQRSAT